MQHIFNIDCPPPAKLINSIPMAGFDFIDAASKAYKYTWDERRFLMHLGLWPIGVKVASCVLIAAFALEDHILRRGLLMMPAYFFEGWLVAQAIRLALFHERWPDTTAGLHVSQAKARHKSVMAGTIVFLLLKLIFSFIAGVIQTGTESQPATAPPQEPGADMIFSVMIILVFMIWMFRFAWLYVPVVLDYPVLRFLKKTQSFKSALQILGLWIICMVPVALVALGMGKIVLLILPGSMPNTASVLAIYLISAILAVAETLYILIASVGMAFAVRELAGGGDRKTMLF